MRNAYILPLVILLSLGNNSTAYPQTTRDIFSYKRILQRVDNICQSFTVSTLRENCNQLLKNSIFFDPDAISFCEKRFRISLNTLECLNTIRDKVYVQSEIRKCDRIITSSQTLDCLQREGRQITYGGCLLGDTKD